MHEQNSPPTRARIKLLAGLVALVVGLLVSEALVRLLLPYNTPETMRAYSVEYEAAPFARSRLRPVGRLVSVDAGKAWGTKPADAPDDRTIAINALGFRGPPFAPRKPAGTTRVIVVGGSSVFDQNVSDDSMSAGNSWPNRAQTLLRARGFTVEVINAGVPGHSSADAVTRLATELWVYEPDIVVLYTGWNDLKAFHGDPISPEHPLARTITPFDATADPYRNYQGWWDRILSSSQLYMKFRNLYVGRRLTVGDEGFLPRGEVASSYDSFGPRQYELDVRAFVDLARNMGALPVLSTQATLALNPDSAVASRIGFAYQLLDREGLRRAYEEVYRIARAVAGEKGVPILEAGPLLNGDATNLADHVHLSATGSEALARFLADFLAEQLARRDSTSS